MRIHFWIEEVQRNAKAMSQVRKPGGHGKEASMLCFPTQSIELFVTNALPFTKNTSLYLSNCIFLSGPALRIVAPNFFFEARGIMVK